MNKFSNYGQKELFKNIKLYLLFWVIACYEKVDFCEKPALTVCEDQFLTFLDRKSALYFQSTLG